MDGLLVIDKPAGPTSHEVVARVRQLIGERRVGHTGTLDPAATGVLPLVVGRATRLARFLSESGKSYDAQIALGVATDTCDAGGTPLGPPHQGLLPSREVIEDVLDAFRGTFLQQPPAYSAKKIAGRRSYRIARADARRVEREGSTATARPQLPEPVPVTIQRIEIRALEGARLSLRVDCSAGCYIRALAHELGERLGVGAHLAGLRRTRSGDLTLSDAIELGAVDREPGLAARALVPTSRMLSGLEAVTLTIEGVRRAVHGRDLGPADSEQGVRSLFQGLLSKKTPDPLFVRLLDLEGQLVGIGELSQTPGFLHPAVVLV